MSHEIHRLMASYHMSKQEAEAFLQEKREREARRKQLVANIPTYYSDTLKHNVTIPNE